MRDRVRPHASASAPPGRGTGGAFDRGRTATAAVAARLDRLLPAPVLVVGSLPPDGRDLDLLVGGPDREGVEEALRGAGLEQRGDVWTGTAGSGLAGAAVELLRAEEWGLPGEELDRLRADARPVPGLTRLVRPAPHHALLILARQLGLGGRLGVRRRRRVEWAVAEDPSAWARATELAGAWTTAASLAWLREAFAGDGDGSRAARLRSARERLGARRPAPRWIVLRACRVVLRPPRAQLALVTLSGLDGAGKSTQAQLLVADLRLHGFDAVVLWNRIIYDSVLFTVTAPLRWVLRHVPGVASRLAADGGEPDGDQPATGRPVPVDTRAARGIRQRIPGLNPLWITLVTLVHALPTRRRTLAQARRGRVVVRDRYLLDSVVHLQNHYGARHVRVQLWLLRHLTPEPLVAFYLDLPAEDAYRRKPEEHSVAALARHRELYLGEASRSGARVVDARVTREELAEIIAGEVRDRLGRPDLTEPGRRRRPLRGG